MREAAAEGVGGGGDGFGDDDVAAAAPLSVIEMAREIYDEGGAGAFFRGAGERVLYWAPAIGIFLTTYCEFRHLFLRS